MKIPEEIALKLAKYEKIKEDKKLLYSQIADWLNNNTEADGVYIGEIFIVDKPRGVIQGGGGYCYQICGHLGDNFSGTYYYPIENSDKYLAYNYECNDYIHRKGKSVYYELPCKYGDTVFLLPDPDKNIYDITEATCWHICLDGNNNVMNFRISPNNYYGLKIEDAHNRVFHSYEEAEKALKEKQKIYYAHICRKEDLYGWT